MFFKRKKIINLNCLSYSGVTWINLVLGSNNKSLYIGPPHRLFNEKNIKLCLICEKCDFWEKIEIKKKKIISNIFKNNNISHIFTNNANNDFYEECDSFFLKKYEILLIRDARAITLSYLKKNKTKINYFNSIHPEGWFYHSFQNLPNLDVYKNLVIKYEDICLQPVKFFKIISDYVEIDFNESQLKFWEYDHHLIMGNKGPIDVIKRFKRRNLFPYNLNKKINNYKKTFEISKNFSKSWKKEISHEQRFFFDLVLGEKNNTLGYERDYFSKKQINKYLNHYKKKVVSGDFKKLPNKFLDRYLSNRK